MNTMTACEAETKRFLIVTLSAREGEAPLINRVEQAGSDPHVGYSFTVPRPIDAIFKKAFAARFHEIIALRNGVGSLLHLPDFALKSGALVLSTCQIFVSRTRSAMEHIIVRFRRLAGNVQDVLSSGLTGVDEALSFTRLAASKCLLDIVRPLRDIGHHIERLDDDGALDAAGPLGEALRTVRERIRALGVDGGEVALSLRALDPSDEAAWPAHALAMIEPPGSPGPSGPSGPSGGRACGP